MRTLERTRCPFLIVMILMLLLPLLAACGQGGPTTNEDEPVKLVVLTHWGAQEYKEVLEPIFERYEEENPGVEIEHQTAPFEELLTRITTARTGGAAPDIYHFYNLWLPEFTGSDLLATPPDEVVEDVNQAYNEGTVESVSYDGQVWGYPTEVNTYQLIYNKAMLEEAGIDTPPATWQALREAAQKTTKRDDSGKVEQAGFLLIAENWDSGVVHPWTTLLWSNGGEYVADDNSSVHFNEPPGVEALQLNMDMIQDGSVDLGLGMDDFVAGKAAMTIMANWWGSTLREGIPGGIENVGVAPIPTNNGNPSTTLQYSWLWGVDRNSEHAEEAWKFVQWLNSPEGGGDASSPMGTYLTTGLNAIPGRVSDQEAHADRLGDPFVSPFVDALENARSEPLTPGVQEIKTSLQKQIEAAWFGQSSAQEALDTAADEANRILQERRGGQ